MAEHNEISLAAAILSYDSAGSTYNSSPELTTSPTTVEPVHHSIFQFNEMTQFQGMAFNDAPYYRYHSTAPAGFNLNPYDPYYGRSPALPYHAVTGNPYARGNGTRKPKNIYNPRFPYLPSYSKNMRRSETINIAFAAVRGCIPNVSEDTKLSKIQTLRLAISYIRFLMSCLGDYRFMMLMNDRERELYKDFFKKENETKKDEEEEQEDDDEKNGKIDKDKIKPRTRWPQLVWQTTLKTCR